MPKLQELDSAVREKVLKHYADHAETLRSIQISAANEAQSFLWATNGGAAVALMAFMGSKELVRESSAAWISLISFFCGILALGLLRAVNYHSTLRQLNGWIVQADKVLRADTEVDAPSQWLSAEIKRLPLVSVTLAYAAFACFIFGCVWAATHLPQLTDTNVPGNH